MARIKSAENIIDPATGKPLPPGVVYRGPLQYRARKLVNGARANKTFETAKLGRQWLEDKSAAVRAGTHVAAGPQDKLTLGELVERYVESEMQDGGRRRGAAEDRKGHVPAILGDAIAKITLVKLRPADMRDFRDRQAAKYAPATIVKRMNIVAAIIAHGRSEWDINLRENPAASAAVRRPRGADRKRTRRLLSPTQAAIRAAQAAGEEAPQHEEAILLTAMRKSCCPADYDLVRWAIASAMRQGEAMALRWRDVDLERRIVTLHGRHGRGTKSAEHREERGPELRPIVPEALAILLDIKAASEPAEDDLIFPVGAGNAFAVRFGRVTNKAGLVDLTFHDLRHEATSRLAARYPNPMDLKRCTGHEDLKSLDRYYQPDLTVLAQVV